MTVNGSQNMPRTDVKITGSGSSAGGFFNQVKIMGDAVINGNADCELFKCLGTAEVRGSLVSESTSLNGTLNVQGMLQGGNLKVQGEVKISKDLSAKVVSINGEIGVDGKMAAESVKINGGLRAAGGCQTEELFVRGAVEVEGMLNGEKVEMKLYGPSRVRELVGGTIAVKKGMAVPLLGMFSPSHEGSLTAESVEGDVIFLENTKAGVVRGRRVTIGHGCEIGLVEYKDDFKQDKDSTVERHVKLG